MELNPIFKTWLLCLAVIGPQLVDEAVSSGLLFVCAEREYLLFKKVPMYAVVGLVFHSPLFENQGQITATMQLKSLLIGALLPLGLMASPTPEAEADVSPAGGSLDPRAAFSRPQHCSIVGGSSTVNCRSGSGTKHHVKVKLKRGVTYDLWCVHSAECVTINGFQNW